VAVFPTAVIMQIFVADKQYPVVHNTLTVEEDVPWKGKNNKRMKGKEKIC